MSVNLNIAFVKSRQGDKVAVPATERIIQIGIVDMCYKHRAKEDEEAVTKSWIVGDDHTQVFSKEDLEMGLELYNSIHLQNNTI